MKMMIQCMIWMIVIIKIARMPKTKSLTGEKIPSIDRGETWLAAKEKRTRICL